MNSQEWNKELLERKQKLYKKVKLYLILHAGTPPRQLDRCLKEKCPHFQGESARCRLQRLHVNRRLYAVFDAGMKYAGIVSAKKSRQYPFRLCASGLVPKESAD